jgi:hypothetical protein
MEMNKIIKKSKKSVPACSQSIFGVRRLTSPNLAVDPHLASPPRDETNHHKMRIILVFSHEFKPNAAPACCGLAAAAAA